MWQALSGASYADARRLHDYAARLGARVLLKRQLTAVEQGRIARMARRVAALWSSAKYRAALVQRRAAAGARRVTAPATALLARIADLARALFQKRPYSSDLNALIALETHLEQQGIEPIDQGALYAVVWETRFASGDRGVSGF